MVAGIFQCECVQGFFSEFLFQLVLCDEGCLDLSQHRRLGGPLLHLSFDDLLWSYPARPKINVDLKDLKPLFSILNFQHTSKPDNMHELNSQIVYDGVILRLVVVRDESMRFPHCHITNLQTLNGLL